MPVFEYSNHLPSYEKSEKILWPVPKKNVELADGDEKSDRQTDRQTEGQTDNGDFIGPYAGRGFKKVFNTKSYYKQRLQNIL